MCPQRSDSAGMGAEFQFLAVSVMSHSSNHACPANRKWSRSSNSTTSWPGATCTGTTQRKKTAEYVSASK